LTLATGFVWNKLVLRNLWNPSKKNKFRQPNPAIPLAITQLGEGEWDDPMSPYFKEENFELPYLDHTF
jgi:hypothetical protein